MEKIESLTRKIGEAVYHPKNSGLIAYALGALDSVAAMSLIGAYSRGDYSAKIFAFITTAAALGGHAISYASGKIKELDEEHKIRIKKIDEEIEGKKERIYKKLGLLRNPANMGIEELFTEKNYSY